MLRVYGNDKQLRPMYQLILNHLDPALVRGKYISVSKNIISFSPEALIILTFKKMYYNIILNYVYVCLCMGMYTWVSEVTNGDQRH